MRRRGRVLVKHLLLKILVIYLLTTPEESFDNKDLPDTPPLRAFCDNCLHL